MTFSLDTEVFGERKTVELIEGGEEVDVTDENKKDYVAYVFPSFPLFSSLFRFQACRLLSRFAQVFLCGL